MIDFLMVDKKTKKLHTCIKCFLFKYSIINGGITEINKEVYRYDRMSLFFIGKSHVINRESYMSAHVLLSLLNELRKSDKMRGLLSILPLFRNEFNKFNNTVARMLDSIYHMTLRLL